MRYQCIDVAADCKIEVWDDVFSLAVRTKAFMFMQNSYFKLGWNDGPAPEWRSHDSFLHSTYNEADIRSLGIVQALRDTAVYDSIAGLEVSRGIVNLSVPVDSHHVHAHAEDHKVLLYYGNLEWKDGWHGETLFYSEDLRDIVWAGPYTPGRVIVFNGRIPHCIRPQSIIAPVHRYTFAMCLNPPGAGA